MQNIWDKNVFTIINWFAFLVICVENNYLEYTVLKYLVPWYHRKYLVPDKFVDPTLECSPGDNGT